MSKSEDLALVEFMVRESRMSREDLQERLTQAESEGLSLEDVLWELGAETSALTRALSKRTNVARLCAKCKGTTYLLPGQRPNTTRCEHCGGPLRGGSRSARQGSPVTVAPPAAPESSQPDEGDAGTSPPGQAKSVRRVRRAPSRRRGPPAPPPIEAFEPGGEANPAVGATAAWAPGDLPPSEAPTPPRPFPALTTAADAESSPAAFAAPSASDYGAPEAPAPEVPAPEDPAPLDRAPPPAPAPSPSAADRYGAGGYEPTEVEERGPRRLAHAAARDFSNPVQEERVTDQQAAQRDKMIKVAAVVALLGICLFPLLSYLRLSDPISWETAWLSNPKAWYEAKAEAESGGLPVVVYAKGLGQVGTEIREKLKDSSLREVSGDFQWVMDDLSATRHPLPPIHLKVSPRVSLRVTSILVYDPRKDPPMSEDSILGEKELTAMSAQEISDWLKARR